MSVLNPRTKTREQIQQEILDGLFAPNQSPYFGMFSAGVKGIPIDMVCARLSQLGVPVREKDVENWKAGMFRHQMETDGECHAWKGNAVPVERGVPFEAMKLTDFPMFPQSWVGTDRRYFPCTQDNRPMQKWGWSKDYSPQLFDIASAKALSPCGWVGQNMLYQRFIVMDIDGVGHGCVDSEVIAWGSQFRNSTLCMEDPAKQGSFHLYFSTDRLIPVKHFPWAKLDLMGNSKNAAVYMKDKTSNGLPMMQLDETVWSSMMAYQKGRNK